MIALLCVVLYATNFSYTNWQLNVLLALLLFALVGILAWLEYNTHEADKLKRHMLLEAVDTAAKHTASNLPLPVVILDATSSVIWYNPRFGELFGEEKLYEKSIFDFLSNLNIDVLTVGFAQKGIEIANRVFDIESSKVADSSDTVLYFFDVTERVHLKKKYDAERMVIVHLNLDNFEEAIKDTKEDHIPVIKSDVEKLILNWASDKKAMIRKYTADKYIAVMTYASLKKVEAEKFTILDKIREIDTGGKMPITLSIGVGFEGETPAKLEEEAFQSLELALGRGGDQAVMRKNGNYEFFGGKSKAVEKRNRVKARVIAHSVRTLIEESTNVMVMGHRLPDMDSFGACVGMFRAAKLLGAENVKIVLESVTPAISAVYSTVGDNPDYDFITPEAAMDEVEAGTLLVVLDTHKPSITEYAPLVDKVSRVVVIDHHRRAAEFIDKAIVKYVEPYASSTCELVTEVLQYITDKPRLLPEEADALLAGITVDTKNFSLRTGVRTYEAAAFLKRNDADPIKVRQLFQDDLETFRNRAVIVGTAERYHEHVAISATEIDSDAIQLIAAQSANDLLDIKGIQASFVIARSTAGYTFVSGRSLGEVNVQVILESIGGGGHLEVAGAQFKDKTVAEVKGLLVEAIDNYYHTEEE